jgi:DNA-binding GntR family transcriptional regulator
VTTVEHKSLRETVTDALRDLILSGELQGGERLIEDKLAERLGVSRNPIREAIRALESMGLVQVVPRHGAYVAVIDNDDADRIQEIRRVLEGWIVTAAAERHEQSDLDLIDRYLDEGTEASEAHDRTRASEAHRAFHMALESATKNIYASVVMEPLRQRTELVFSVIGGTGNSSHQWDEHRAIRDAIASRDADQARTLIEAHITSAMQQYASAGGSEDAPDA